MTPAMREAKHGLRALGCRIVKKSPHHLVFRLLNGAEWTVHTSTSVQRAREVVEAQRRLSANLADDALTRSVSTHSAPMLKAYDYDATTHFKGRLALMREQGLKYPEVVAALLDPDETRVGDNGRWLYVKGRVAVVVDQPRDGKYPLITILWATRELYAMNPRR